MDLYLYIYILQLLYMYVYYVFLSKSRYMDINRPSVTFFRIRILSFFYLCDLPGRSRRRIRRLRIPQRSRGSAEVPREKTKSPGSPSGFFVGISSGDLANRPWAPQQCSWVRGYFRKKFRLVKCLSFWPGIVGITFTKEGGLGCRLNLCFSYRKCRKSVVVLLVGWCQSGRRR